MRRNSGIKTPLVKIPEASRRAICKLAGRESNYLQGSNHLGVNSTAVDSSILTPMKAALAKPSG